MIDIDKFHRALENVWKMFPEEIVGMPKFQETVTEITDVAISLYNSMEEKITYKEILKSIADDLKEDLGVLDE